MPMMTLRKSGQSLRNLNTISPVTARATRQLMMVWAAKTGRRGAQIGAAVAPHDDARDHRGRRSESGWQGGHFEQRGRGPSPL